MTLNISKDKLAEMLMTVEFPRSAKYDPEWIAENQMGPSALWLTEWLCREMRFGPGMRVLDMGCGKALSSVFLAREFGVQVWANDLWIPASDNWKRIQEAALSDRVFPIHAEARSLPYAEGFFDAIVCVDSYNFYGTDDFYLIYFSKFVKPGGQIGIVVPALMREFNGPVPEHFTRKQSDGKIFWAEECWSVHTLAYWQNLWGRSGLIEVEVADTLPNGGRLWLQWERAITEAGMSQFPHELPVLEADEGRYLGFVRMVARRKEVI